MNIKTPSAKTLFEILSQVFTNLSAGWFGVVLIIPGVTKFPSFDDLIWLTRNFLFGILALVIAIYLSEKGKDE